MPNFRPNDACAGFENAVSIQKFTGRGVAEESIVRYRLGRGIKHRADLGATPFKYRFAGGTDSHNGTPGNVGEDNHTVGSHGLADRTAEVRSASLLDGEMPVTGASPRALTAVWAVSNTRGAIRGAMMARETFATSGPRMKVRIFAGQGFSVSYAKGVPMGGTAAPQFLVRAVKDPIPTASWPSRARSRTARCATRSTTLPQPATGCRPMAA